MATPPVCSVTKLSDLSTSSVLPTASREDITLSAQDTISLVEQRRASIQWALAPRWAPAAVDGLLALLTLRDNWDSYGARPIETKVVERAVSLLLALMSEHSPPPLTVPTSVGGVQLEWHSQGIDLEIEISPGGVETAFSRDGRTGGEWEDELPAALPRVKGVITQFSS